MNWLGIYIHVALVFYEPSSDHFELTLLLEDVALGGFIEVVIVEFLCFGQT